MDLDVISAPIRKEINLRSTSPAFSRPRSPGSFRQRNIFPHSPANTTMNKNQFDEYVKNAICFVCGKKGHLRTMCQRRNNGKRPSIEGGSNSMLRTSNKPPKPPDKQLKTVTFSDPLTLDIHIDNNNDNEPPMTIFSSRLPYYDLPDNKLPATSLTTMNLHMHENICFKLSATINDCNVSVLLDTGSQITSMTTKVANKLNLPITTCEPLKLRLGNNTTSETLGLITNANLRFGTTEFATSFRLMNSQPYDIILGANFIVASKATYDPVSMTIKLSNDKSHSIFKMMPSGLHATEWAPLVLAASAIDSLPKADSEISAILRDVATLFDPTPTVIKTDFPHRLRLTTDQPVHARMRRYSPEETRTLREHVQELYKAGYARPSTSPYSANPLIVPKADGTPRVVINFRPLNKVTIRDEYPLPRIDVILNQLFGCRFYSKLDVMKAFYQIPLHSDSIEASAFSTPDGHHEFLVMPQGMSNSPATFQRNIDRTLRECIDDGYCVAFADDILVFSKSREEHLVHIQKVLQKLSEKGFKLNSKKCIFSVPKVDILGFTVSEHGQEIADTKISAVKDFPRPTSVPTLRRFLGMTSFCRSFIDNFTELAAPLYTLLQKDKAFDWDSDCETSFQKLKNAMISAPVLAHPDTSKPYIMYTDASNVGIGASLHQKQYDGTVRPIAYASRKLLPAERNYCASDKEALAVVYGFDKFHHYVHGTCTELHTDHRALITALKNEDPRGRIARWNSALQAYDFEIKHVKGLDNGLTDALSRDFIDNNDMLGSQFMPITRSQGPPTRTLRRPGKLDILADVSSDKTNDDFDDENSEYTSEDNYNDEIELDEEIINDNDTTTNTTTSNKFYITEFLPSSTTFEKAQQSDAKCKQIIDILNGTVNATKHSAIQSKSYCIKNKLLYNCSNSTSPRLYVPNSLVTVELSTKSNQISSGPKCLETYLDTSSLAEFAN
ncbi:Retrovirus-related Pol polyprotein from transposon [Smittium culicis]|uniref:Retrovirus-related Pol polyprotein from transposon n=1 Tax=Smittium culicis TaxID=133412 RepID=A0A1R1Y5B5_9FUNG|nr:Retrovirus-related Pol polyprotein from transposon [Smittium culicis]